MSVLPKTPTVFMYLQLHFYQLIYPCIFIRCVCVYSLQPDYTTNLYRWLHLSVCLCGCVNKKRLLEFMYLCFCFFIYVHHKLPKCVPVCASPANLYVSPCVCVCRCVFVYRKCLLYILVIASCVCVCTENANYMFWWLHFVNWFMFIHL